MARRTIDDLLADARAGLQRIGPGEAAGAVREGAALIDIRADAQIARDGVVPGALVIGRNVLEWRLDPASAHRHPQAPGLADRVILMCDEGYQSSLAAATLQQLGFARATDLDGGFQAWRAAGLPAIHRCGEGEHAAILAIVNAAAEAYRGVIPPDRWHEPYMTADELHAETEAGVVFWGCEAGGALSGVMGLQRVRDVDLIRHAYVAPVQQGRGLGGALLEHLVRDAPRPLLVGTWAAATWAIRFYERHGFAAVGPERTAELLRRYWDIPERQIATSVVLERRSAENP